MQPLHFDSAAAEAAASAELAASSTEETLLDVMSPVQARRALSLRLGTAASAALLLAGVAVFTVRRGGVSVEHSPAAAGLQPAAASESPALRTESLGMGSGRPAELFGEPLIRVLYCSESICDCSWASGGAYSWCSSINCPNTPGCPAPSNECWDCCCSQLFPDTYARATSQEYDWPDSPYGIFLALIVLITFCSILAVSCWVIFYYFGQDKDEIKDFLRDEEAEHERERKRKEDAERSRFNFFGSTVGE